MQAESSQRLQQLLQQEEQLRREIAAQRELFRKGSSSTDELLLAKHELTTLKHELQVVLSSLLWLLYAVMGTPGFPLRVAFV